jgi:hypothetical protein
MNSFRCFVALLLLSLCVAVVIGAPTPTPKPPATRPAPVVKPREETGKHPDGSVSFRVRLGSDGKRTGDYIGYFEGGKKVQERSRYEAGELHGIRTLFDDKGRPIGDETWYRGKLVFPKSTRLIDAMRDQIKRDVVEYFQKANVTVPKGGMTLAALVEALIKVRTYRYLCDVPHDVGLDSSYIDLCQHGAEVMALIDEMTHTPRRPPGVSDEFYEKGRKGCGSSNIFTSNNIAASVDAYMDDSNERNIDRLGHRRWVISPSMQNTGFGAGTAKFSAMYSFDKGRQEVPDYSFVCYPPRGYCPVNLIAARAAWHASFNPSKYGVSAAVTKMAIYLVDGKLTRAREPLELDYKNVDLGGFGISNAVIARPKAPVVKAGAMYEVVITGLQPKDDAPAEVSYYVVFY